MKKTAPWRSLEVRPKPASAEDRPTELDGTFDTQQLESPADGETMPYGDRAAGIRPVTTAAHRTAAGSDDDPASIPDAAGYDSLARYCASVGISPRINPGLDDDAPGFDVRVEQRYTVGKELGQGGGGVVQLAVDSALRRSVALKSLARERATDPIHVQAFLEEASITGGLEHPNIVPAYDVGIRPGHGLYYTMKRLTGQTLANVFDYLRAGDADYVEHFTLPRMLGFFIEICRALVYAHGRGVLHTDLKPENIFIGAYGEVTVVDWGLAQVLGPQGQLQARAHMRAGTPEYMSPEQITSTGQNLDERADVWALGVILYELLTLEVPFYDETVRGTASKVLLQPVRRPSALTPKRDIPADVEAICLRALERNLARRFASVADMLWDVDAYLAGARERNRRLELAHDAVAEVDQLLAAVAALERRVDAMPDATDSYIGEVNEVDEGALDELASVYAEACEQLQRGYAAGGDRGVLGEAAGALYWRIFGRVFGQRVRPTSPRAGSLRTRASAMLGKLAGRALPAIVQAGRELAAARGLVVDEDGSAWLSVARALSRGAGDAASSPVARYIQRIALLRSVAIFASIPDHNLLRVCEVCVERVYEPGDVIFTQGERGDALCVIVDGEVSIERDDEEINKIGPRSCVGEIAVLGATERTASVIAIRRTTCLLLEASQFRAIALTNGELAMGLVGVLNERLRVATEREAALRALTNKLLEQQDA